MKFEKCDVVQTLHLRVDKVCSMSVADLLGNSKLWANAVNVFRDVPYVP